MCQQRHRIRAIHLAITRALPAASPPLHEADLTLGKLPWAVSNVISRSWSGPYGQGAALGEAAQGVGFIPQGAARAPDGSANGRVTVNPTPGGSAAYGGAVAWESSLWAHTLIPGR